MVAQGKWGALRSPHITHTYGVLQLKAQAGGTLPWRSALRRWNVAAGSPTWILLEFHQPCHPTTATITFIPASRKPACSQKPSCLQST